MKLHILIFILVFSCIAFAQTSREKCYLTVKDSPVLRDIKLGMTPGEVSKVLGVKVEIETTKTSVYIKKEGDNYKEISISGSEDYKKYRQEVEIGESLILLHKNQGNLFPEKLKGVDMLRLKFYKNILYSISIDYSNEINWTNVNEFVYLNSAKLNLPANAWRVDETIGSISCIDFYLMVILGRNKNIYLRLDDEKTEKQVQQTAKDKFIEQDKQSNIVDLEKKKTFKP